MVSLRIWECEKERRIEERAVLACLMIERIALYYRMRRTAVKNRPREKNDPIARNSDPLGMADVGYGALLVFRGHVYGS